jgi:hypothetical protein
MNPEEMDLLSEIEGRLAEWLAGQAELAVVKKFEPELRAALLSGEELTKGFPDAELPAINIVAGLEDTVSVPRTMSSTTVAVPVSIVVVVKGEGRNEARRKCRGVQDALELVLNRLRCSNNRLGGNTVLVGEVRSSCSWEQNGPRYYGLGETKVTIQRIREMSL